MVSEREVRQAREHVATEIAPFLRELIVRAEEVLARDEREARSLRNKVRIFLYAGWWALTFLGLARTVKTGGTVTMASYVCWRHVVACITGGI